MSLSEAKFKSELFDRIYDHVCNISDILFDTDEDDEISVEEVFGPVVEACVEWQRWMYSHDDEKVFNKESVA